MDPVLTRKQARELDTRVIEAGVPSVVLMENAGRGAAEVIARVWPGARLLVVCGPGNNGGDGLVVARRWLVWGMPVCVWLTTRTLSSDAQVQLAAYEACGGRAVLDGSSGVGSAEWAAELQSAEVVVDALFGTGLSRQVTGPLQALIVALNESGKPIVALDLPSGLDCDRGSALGVSVRAHTTVSFGCAKRAAFTPFGKSVCGHVELVDIGVPLPTATLSTSARSDERIVRRPRAADVALCLAARGRVNHKGQAGHVLVVAGSVGTTGAALLAARGAFRAGAGVVTIATHVDTVTLLEAHSPEVMKVGLVTGPAGLERLQSLIERATTIVVGPGLGFSADARVWVEHVVTQFHGTVVVDADALTLCSSVTLGDKPSDERTSNNLVFTPHPGEAARLLGCTTRDVEDDRFGALDRLVELTQSVVVLKGAPSLVGDKSARYVTHDGAPCMSTAGSGDVLAGAIAALACQLSAFDAAWVGAWIHAAAGELWAQTRGNQRGMLAGELADNIPQAMATVV